MNVDFNSIAKSRARYYLKGCPVQFVQVELLRMENAQSMAVTLTFKNIAPLVLNALNISYVCKDKTGNIVAQNSFAYNNLQVAQGESFGSNDAVFVSEVPLSNVEVTILNAQYNEKTHNLTNCRAIPLPALQPMGASTADKTNNMLNIQWAMYIPCNVEDGWQCTCGAFNYNTGKSETVCSECALDKETLFNVVRAIIKGANTSQAQQINNVQQAGNFNANVQDQSNMYGQLTDNGFDEFNSAVMSYDELYEEKTAVMPSVKSKPENTVSLMSNATANAIMRFAPLVTLAAGSLYITILLLIKLFLN